MVTAPFSLRRQIPRRALVLTAFLFCTVAGSVSSRCQEPAAGQPVPGVQTIPLEQPTAASLDARKKSLTVTVTGSEWVDTQLLVAPGDSIVFAATGDISLSDGRQATADGSARGWKRGTCEEFL